MDVKIALLADRSGDELRSLRAWLVEEDALRGRVRVVAGPPRPGTMGAAAEALLVMVGPGGGLAVLSGVLITWLRQRTSDVTLTASRDGDRSEVQLSVRRMRDLDAAGVRQQVAELERLLGGERDAGERPSIER